MRAFWLGRDLFVTPERRKADRKRAKAVLGKPLKPTQPIHHHSITQIVICEDNDYHRLLHRREKVLRNGGKPATDAMCGWCYSPKPAAGFDPPSPFGGSARCEYCRLAQHLEMALWNANVRIYGSGLGWEPPEPSATWDGKTAEELGVQTVFDRNRAADKARACRILDA